MNISIPWKLPILAAFLTVCCAHQTLAQHPVPPPPREGRSPALRMNLFGALNLTPDQVAQIRSLERENRKASMALRDKLRQAQQALDEAIYADVADESLIEARARDVAEAHGALIGQRAMMELNIRRVLTAEQLNTLRELRQRARKSMRERMQRRGMTRPKPGNQMMRRGQNQ